MHTTKSRRSTFLFVVQVHKSNTYTIVSCLYNSGIQYNNNSTSNNMHITLYSFLLCLSTFLWFPFSTLLGWLWLHMTLTTYWLYTTSNFFARLCLCRTQALPTSTLINRSLWWGNPVRTTNMVLTEITLCYRLTWRFNLGVLGCTTIRRVSSTAVETWWQARLCSLRPM